MWLIGSVLKHCKVPKYYDQDCRYPTNDTDGTHHIGNKNKALKNDRAIIIKFTWYNIRKKVFVNNKRKFKGTNISVTESLTSLRMTKVKDARDHDGFKKV